MKLRIKSEAFFKNYVESKGKTVAYDGGYMDSVSLPGDRVTIVNSMRWDMGESSDSYLLLNGCYYCFGWNWPLWMCEEVEVEDEDED